MTATRILLVGVLLAFAGVALATPAATAHYEVNVSLCFDVCTCATLVEHESERHVHTYCLEL